MESVDSTYGCVLLRGRVVAATKNWYSLHPDEVNLLSLVVTTDAWATLKVPSMFFVLCVDLSFVSRRVNQT